MKIIQDRTDKVEAAGREQPAEQARMLPLPSDTGKAIRGGMLLLVLGFGGFMAWAIWAPLDEGVPAPGTVMVESSRKQVQHPSGGVVKEILVKEARTVRAGDILLRMEDTQAGSAFEATQQTLFYLQAMEARLLAEQVGRREVRFDEDLLRETHPKAAEHMEAQRRLFAARRTALAGQIAVVEESAAAAEAQAFGLEEQIRFLRPQLEGMRDLAAEGYAPRNRQLELERQLAELLSGAVRARRSVAEAKLRMVQLRQDFLREVETQLADVKRERATTAERLRAQREDLDRTLVRAPAGGIVTGLAVHTVGGVIGAGQKLMEIVPAGETLILEAQVATHMIDRVHPGLSADITISAFVSAPDMVIEGRVISVAADALPSAQPQEPPHYLARIEVTPEGLKKLGQFRLQPGMQASVVIKTGERSLMGYLMKPFMRRLRMALTEV